MHDNYDLRQEQMNKSSLVSSRKFLGTLLDIFTTHVVSAMNFSSASTWECYEFLPIFPLLQFSFKFSWGRLSFIGHQESIAGWLWPFLMAAFRAHALSSIRLCMIFYHYCDLTLNSFHDKQLLFKLQCIKNLPPMYLSW